MMKKKIYFHIGYPKTATVFLQKKFFSKQKEIEFFCRNFSVNNKSIFLILNQIILMEDEEYIKEKKKIKKNFDLISFSKNKINLISDQNILCHKYRANNDIYRTLDRIKEIFKKDDFELNIFFSTRKQDDAILSIYRQFYFSYFEKNLPNLNKIFSNIKNKEIKEILESLKYYKIFSFLSNKFGEKNVKIFPYELLKNDKKLFLEKLSNYLNIKNINMDGIHDNEYENDFKSKKVSLFNAIKYNLSNKDELIKNFSKKIYRFFKFIIFEYFSGIKRLKKLSELKINEDTKKILFDLYKEDNLKLKKLIGIDYIDEK